MKFLAIDTSGKYMSVVAYSEEKTVKIFLDDCTMKHSVVLMEKIDEAFSRAHLSAGECDFFATVIGPGSFTGIRIGISTVKGLCYAAGKPALAVTSFDCIAYNAEGKRIALVDAGRGELYACAYDGDTIVRGPEILSIAAAETLVREGFAPLSAERVPMESHASDPAAGLLRAVLCKTNEIAPASELHAFYMRKSSAEENRK